jgi:phosphoenolpyruvate-protein kinase (PTS system EI component)
MRATACDDFEPNRCRFRACRPSSLSIAAKRALRGCSFLVSIGTNDLLQYTLAADRGNPALERYRDPLHPALLRLVRLAVEAAGRSRIELSVCGEMAGEPLAALALVGLGVRSLSMVAPSIPAVAEAIRGTVLRDIEHAAIAALSEASAAQVRSRMAHARGA